MAVASLLIAKYLGAEVYATSRDEAKRNRAKELGAVEAFDSAGPYPVKVEVVVDSVGVATWEPALRALDNGGRFVTCGATSGVEVPLLLPRLFFKHQELIGVTTGSHLEFVQVTDHVARGLPVIVDEVFPFDAYPDALTKLAKCEQVGKLVLEH